MKTIKISIKLTFFLIAALLFSCVNQEFDAPPATSLPEGDTVTINDIVTEYTNSGVFKFTEDKYLYATVVGDESSGTFYKELYVQDLTGGLNIKMESSANNVRIGDRVKIILKDLEVGDYSNLIQLQGVKPAYDIIVLENQKFIEPKTVTIQELKTLAFTGQLIKLEGMQFIDAELNSLFAPKEVTANRNIKSCDKESIVIRSSGYSNFQDKVIKDIAPGNGSIIAIASEFDSKPQLYIRDIREVDFNGERCAIEQVDATESLIEDFNSLSADGDAEDLTGWRNYVLAGDRGWQGKEFPANSGELYVQASGFKSGLDDMQTWLITPALDLNGGDRAFGFESAISFWAHTSGDPLKVMLSTDYDGINFEAATWVELTAKLADQSTGDNNWLKSDEIDLSAYTGIGYVAFAYSGSDTESTSFRIDNFEFDQKGTTTYAGGGSTGTGTGTGTFDDPYDVVNAIDLQGETGVWAKGYLVGVYETVDASGNTLDPFAPSFTGSFYTNSNVIIAADANETDITKCVVVQLTSGEIRTITNLVDNPTNKGQEVMYMGDLAAYFGAAGLKSTTGYWFNGSGLVPVEPTGFFIEEFKTTLGNFTTYSVTGTQVWVWASYGSGCAKMSGYQSGNFANEDWLISPAIDLTGKTGVNLNFTTAVNYLDTWDNLKVVVSENYSGTGDPTSATWTEITGWHAALTGSSFDFFSSGDIAMTSYEGKTIYLGFQYISSASAGSTWEIGDIFLSEN